MFSRRVPASPEFVVVLVTMQSAPPEMELEIPVLNVRSVVPVLLCPRCLSALASMNARLESARVGLLVECRLLRSMCVLCRCLTMERPLGMERNLCMSRVTPGFMFLMVVTCLLLVLTSVFTELNLWVTECVIRLFMRWTFRLNSMCVSFVWWSRLIRLTIPVVTAPFMRTLLLVMSMWFAGYLVSVAVARWLQKLVMLEMRFVVMSPLTSLLFRLLTLTVPWSI